MNNQKLLAFREGLGNYSTDSGGFLRLERDFIDVWEEHFLETEEMFYLAPGVFQAAILGATDVHAIIGNLQTACYTIFNFDLCGYVEILDSPEVRETEERYAALEAEEAEVLDIDGQV